MKKLQLTNIITIGIILLILSITVILGIGELKKIGTQDDDWIAFGLIPLIFTIIAIWYLKIAIKVYKSEKSEGKIMKISSWINLVNLPIIILFLIISIIGFSQGGDPLGWAILLYFTFIIVLPLFLISFILFLIGKRKLFTTQK